MSMWEFEKNDSQRLYILMFSDHKMALFEKITRVGDVILLEVGHFQVCGMGFGAFETHGLSDIALVLHVLQCSLS